MQIKPISFNYKYNFNSQNLKNANCSSISFDALDLNKRKKPAHMAPKKTLAKKLEDAIYDYTVKSYNASLAKRAKKKQKSRHFKFKPSKTVAGTREKLRKDFGIVATVGFEHKDIDVLNWVYHAFVNLSNKTGGKFVESIDFVDYVSLDKKTMAAVRRYSDGYSALLINKEYYQNIDKKINKNLEILKESGKILKFEDGEYKLSYLFNSKETREVVLMIKDYEKGKLTSFEDKVALMETLAKMNGFYGELNNCPSKYLRQLGYSISDIEKMSKEESYRQLLQELNKGDVLVHIHKENPFGTIYHEICHSRDIRRHRPVKSYAEYGNYPEILKNWFKNQKDLDAAYSVSSYAADGGPDEFIAETYSQLIAGKGVTKEAYRLYRKYHGPRLVMR